MKATEQLTAMDMMAVNPIARVVAPRFWGGVISMPLLAGLFSAIGVFGGYLIGVVFIGVDEGAFWSQMQGSVDFRFDVWNGVIESFCFGVAVSELIAVYLKATMPSRPLEGESVAIKRTVVYSALAILALDFVSDLLHVPGDLMSRKLLESGVGFLSSSGIAALLVSWRYGLDLFFGGYFARLTSADRQGPITSVA